MGGSGGAAIHTRRTRHSFAFAMHAARTGSKAVIVTSEDTDVVLLCLAFQNDIPCPIYQNCGTQNSARFVEISKLAWSLVDSICDSLIWLHAFTGCDTLSAFDSRRKLSALKRMKSETFSQVGQSWDVQSKLDSHGMYSYPRRYNNSHDVCMWLLAALI